MKSIHSIRPLAIGLAGILAACTNAGRFQEADPNGDGYSSHDEFTAYMKREVFAIADQNSDGQVTEAEWKAFNPESERREFVRADRDGSGGVSRSEADVAFDREGTLDRLFDRIDTDGSKTLSKEELSAFKAKVGQQPGNGLGQKISSAAQS